VAAVRCESCHDAPRRLDGPFHQAALTDVVLLRSRDGNYVVRRPVAAVPNTPDAACVTCHAGATTAGSVHEGRRCVDCHRDAKPERHTHLDPPACGSCHVDEAGNVARAIHGVKAAEGDTEAPSCVTCHGGHEIRHAADPQSRTHPLKVAGLCMGCHGNAEFLKGRNLSIALDETLYQASVHGRPSSSRGLAISATCIDCHNAHDIRPRNDPGSRIHFTQLAKTCGRCHASAATEYLESSHGRSGQRGAHEAPVCSDCHGEHAVLPSSDPRSLTHRVRIGQMLCLGCHDRPALARKFGLSGGRGASFLDSYHGLASRGGSTAAAVCTDCHGTHRILGVHDPRSTIHADNRTATCARCHSKATPRFAEGMIHFSYGDHWLTSLVRLLYRGIIGGTLGGMLVWVLLLTWPAVRKRFSAASIPAPRRFLPAEIIQHALLAVSFITLAVTGFALAFPDAAWVQPLQAAGLTERLRGILHRLAGLTLIGLGLAHGVYLLGTARGRWLLRRMFPAIRDAREARDHALWALGRRAHPPVMGHFAYMEKAEYWALLWGSIVMAATGLVLWFPEFLPRLFIVVCEAVHYYEALLAVGAILIWHLYFAIFDPEVYPLNPAIFRGRAALGTEIADRTDEPGAGTAAEREASTDHMKKPDA
jgi:cytochrome b subunit of formate dehydrogenase